MMLRLRSLFESARQSYWTSPFHREHHADQQKKSWLQNWDLIILQFLEMMKLGKIWWETTRQILSLQGSVHLEYENKSRNSEFIWWLTWLFQDIQPINKYSTWNERRNNLVNPSCYTTPLCTKVRKCSQTEIFFFLTKVEFIINSRI